MNNILFYRESTPFVNRASALFEKNNIGFLGANRTASNEFRKQDRQTKYEAMNEKNTENCITKALGYKKRKAYVKTVLTIGKNGVNIVVGKGTNRGIPVSYALRAKETSLLPSFSLLKKQNAIGGRKE